MCLVDFFQSQYKRLKSNFINLHAKYLLLKSIGADVDVDDDAISK